MSTSSCLRRKNILHESEEHKIKIKRPCKNIKLDFFLFMNRKYKSSELLKCCCSARRNFHEFTFS